MELVNAILQAFLDKRLTDTRQTEKVAKKGCWMLKISPRRELERGE